MKAAQITKAGNDFELVDLPLPEPGDNEILIKIQTCGICHSDAFVKEGLFPGIEYPRVPGHEVVGTVKETGKNVTEWKEGQRVGVGWHGGHCFTCDACRKGDFINCSNGKICGISYNGGYAEYMTAPKEAIAAIPDELSSEEAAPLLCAGITTFNALRNSGAKPGDLVAVQGIGGLGHLAIQYAVKMGFRTVAISGSNDKEDLAKELGAHIFINAGKHDPADELQQLGGARVILATAPNSEAISALTGGLGLEGNLLIVAASGEAVEVSPLSLIMGRKRVSGWPSGTAKDSEDTLQFSALTGAKTIIETYPLEQVNEAYSHMINNKARFRTVLTMDNHE